MKEIIIRNSATPPYLKLFAWFNKVIFDWSGSDARGINGDIEDTDSGVEEAILQMDGLYLDDDDDNPPANVDTGRLGPSNEVNLFLILIYYNMTAHNYYLY